MFHLFRRNLHLAYQASKFYVVALTVVNVVAGILNLAQALLFARLIDVFVSYFRGASPDLARQIWVLFGLSVARWVLSNLCGHFSDYLGAVYSPRVMNFVDNAIVLKLDSLPTAVIESSDFQNRMNTIHTFGKDKFVDNLRQLSGLIGSATQFVYASIVLLLSNPWLAVLILLISLPEVRYNLNIIKKMRQLNERLTLERRTQSYFTSLTQDITQYFNLKSFNLFPYFLEKIKKAQNAIVKGARDIQAYHKPRAIGIGTGANLLGQFLPKGYYIWAALAGKITLGQLQLYYQMIERLYDSSYAFYSSYLQIAENNIYVADLFALLDMAAEQTARSVAVDLDTVELEFQHVSFRYPESEKYVLRDVSFRAAPGERLALVGHNGAGKTTITRLINKFYEPTEGVILVNGVDLQLIDSTWWRAHLSNLSQDVPHFFLSPKESVQIGDQNFAFDEKRYRRSVKRAVLTKDIAALPSKDDNALGKYFPGGVNLSGGQAPLLILDEPTSAIDAKTEQEIFAELFAEQTNQTQVIVSHKFSNIKQADQIVVLENGRIIEQGTHASLIKTDGEYAALYRLQSAAFAEEVLTDATAEA